MQPWKEKLDINWSKFVEDLNGSIVDDIAIKLKSMLILNHRAYLDITHADYTKKIEKLLEWVRESYDHFEKFRMVLSDTTINHPELAELLKD